MKLFFIGILFPALAFSQIGINTSNPKSTLDITAKNADGSSTNVDGLLVPRIDRRRAQSMINILTSTLVFIDNSETGTQSGIAVNIDTVGYYYYDGKTWVKLHNPTNASFASSNIYNANGTLTGNRTVTQNANRLSFTGTAVNAFSVAENTLSIDAANKKVGMGTTTPSSTLSVITRVSGGLTDAVSAGINNCGAPCGQQSARNITLYNMNSSNGQFAGLDFIPGTSETGISGASIVGMDRDISNNYAGLQFFTRNASGYEPRVTLKSSGNVGVGTEDPTEKMDINGNLRVRDVPLGDLDSQDNYLGISSTGVLKRINVKTSSFILFATKTTTTNLTGGEGNNSNLDFNFLNNINSNYIEKVSGTNKFKVKKSGIYSIEIVGKFNNIPVGNNQEKGVALRLHINNDIFQVRGERWANDAGTSYLHQTVILNQNDEIYLQTQTGKSSYTQSPGSSIFITYIPN